MTFQIPLQTFISPVDINATVSGIALTIIVILIGFFVFIIFITRKNLHKLVILSAANIAVISIGLIGGKAIIVDFIFSIDGVFIEGKYDGEGPQTWLVIIIIVTALYVMFKTAQLISFERIEKIKRSIDSNAK